MVTSVERELSVPSWGLTLDREEQLKATFELEWLVVLSPSRPGKRIFRSDGLA